MKLFAKKVKPFVPKDNSRTSHLDGIAVKCCECTEDGLAMWEGIRLVPQYHWRMFRVRLKTYFICPKCQARRREWAKQFYKP